jgi:hypothetical protein
MQQIYDDVKKKKGGSVSYMQYLYTLFVCIMQTNFSNFKWNFRSFMFGAKIR